MVQITLNIHAHACMDYVLADPISELASFNETTSHNQHQRVAKRNFTENRNMYAAMVKVLTWLQVRNP